MTATKPTVLICDDEEGVRESLRLILDEHYDLLMAEDGLKALETLRARTPDVLLLDMKLPKMDGLDTLRRIREVARDIPVLIVTAYHSTEVAQETIRLGALDYIPKPFEGAQVLAAIEKALEKAKARK